MAVENDDPDGAAARLELALERIARAAGRAEAGSRGLGESLPVELAPRLDQLIARLRTALGEPH